MNLLAVMTRVAAKPHKCCECGRVIAEGDNEALVKAYALKHGVQAGATLT